MGDNPFERHGLDHLSPSSLNTFFEEPAFWTMKYLHGYEDGGGPAAWRGSAVEAGLDHWFEAGDKEAALAAALSRFEEDAAGWADDEPQRERESIAPMLALAVKAVQGIEPPEKQVAVEYRFYGIEIPVIGRADYEWPERGIDLKTTRRMPTEIPSRHARQISLYRAARGRPYSLLYVTPTQTELMAISDDDATAQLKRLEWLAHTIRRILAMSSCKIEIARMFTPDFNHISWRKPEARLAARSIWYA